MLETLLQFLKSLRLGSTDNIMASFHKTITKLENVVESHNSHAEFQAKIAADAQAAKEASLAEVAKAKEAAQKLRALVGNL